MISFLLGKSVGVTRVLRVRLSTASSAAERSEQELIGLTVALTKLSYKANSTVSGISGFSEFGTVNYLVQILRATYVQSEHQQEE